MEYKDYYKTLGVEKYASADDIKKAYRRQVRKHHPDVSRAGDADQRTKEINEAYAVLGDAQKRSAYDAAGSHTVDPLHGARRSGAHGGGFGSQVFGAHGMGREDIFADLFSHVGRQAAGGGHARRGPDVQASLVVTLQDAYTGATCVLTLRVPGQGGHAGRRVSVSVPRGVLPGQVLRLAGQGQGGFHGGPAGDLLLEVRFQPDARYRIEGRHVTARLPVAPWEAALGASIDVPTPSGQINVTVPADSQAGRRLRLRGRGIPGAGGETAGDLFLELDVVLPPAGNARARELYQAMARELAFDARAAARGAQGRQDT